MSFKPDDVEHERTIQDQNEDIIKLLKAVVMLLEIMADHENIIDNVEE